ncbi:hypothetical protein ACTJJ0_11170 [Chitinophaga sp. 22321]|uniref:hypothetical protein n=1 Tax=Chitinophaga sp. 22321 TaxID=3453909 RepID=UPI003F873758
MLVSLFQSPVLFALLLSALTYTLVNFYIKLKGKLDEKRKQPILQMAADDGHLSNSLPGSSYDPIHIPATTYDSPLELTLEREDDDSAFELVDDDDSILLKEAENVTEEISRIINNIASNPPNHIEVHTKIKAIVSQYQIFKDTEFYDAINRYIYVSVSRDLNITFTDAQLLEMWSE